MTSLDQGRASHVLRRHDRHKRWLEARPDNERVAFWKAYCTLADSLPSAVRFNGLILAYAMLVRRISTQGVEPGELALAADLTDWLRMVGTNYGWSALGHLPSLPDDVESSTDDAAKNIQNITIQVRDRLIDLDQRSYRLLQEEVLASLAWIKTLSSPHRPSHEEETTEKSNDTTE